MISPQAISVAYNWDFARTWWLLLILIGIVAAARIGWIILKRYRREVLGEDPLQAGWTLDDLERLRDSGQLSDQEFKILREGMICQSMTPKRGNQPGKSTSPGRPNDKIGE